MNINQIISEELNITNNQVVAVVNLLDNDATVPFIARYRKEVTGGLDDTQLRQLEERLIYLRDLSDRKETVLKSIKEQGKLTEDLEKKIGIVLSKSELEDIYLPFKPKRRTKAQIAKEAGLEPLAMGLLADPNLDPKVLAKDYINLEHKIENIDQALDGAKYILMDLLSEDADISKACRKILWDNAVLKSSIIQNIEDKKKDITEKFRDYFEYQENIKTIPSHRALALFRGRNLDILRLQIELADETNDQCKFLISNKFNIEHKNRPADDWLQGCVDWAWKIKLLMRLELDAYTRLREEAEQEAIRVFAENLNNLLMSAPAGGRVTMGLDPGYRTGVKVAVVDETGKLLTHTAIYPHAPQNQWQNALDILAVLCQKLKVELISIGNGTASRETDKLASELIKKNPDLKLTKIVVSEAGASVYSASELASKEFPDLDVSFRGAVSIARRLQDPLAELVKIEPKSIGVGQYQHDVNQFMLARKLDNTVEDCVNQVGVDVNIASVELLAKISGLNSTLAKNIVDYRNKNGIFKTREDLKKVARMGDKTFEQSAGFLRIINGNNPLDSSAVHPESYPLVLDILKVHKIDLQNINNIIGNKKILAKIKPEDHVNSQYGLPTIKDILKELDKPGRDPRPDFVTAEFKEGVETLADLKPDMKLEGVVTNVTPFGAFVDIGVHQDGLVHKSRLADRFVENPSDIVKVGQVVSVRVLEVDQQRSRISLTMKTNDSAANSFVKANNSSFNSNNKSKNNFSNNKNNNSFSGSAMADAFNKAFKK